MFAAFLGLGQGGSNIADEAAKQGFYAGAINYSQKDLDSLEHIDLKLKLVGSEGVGKNRSEAIQLMQNNWDLATNFVKENFSHPSIELIFVPFSTGGGSGSGIAPVLLNILIESMPEKTFVAMPILPDKTEVIANQRNCLETFEDLSHLNIAILPIDNDKVRSTSIYNGKNRLYKQINENVVNKIKKIIDYTEQHSKYSVFDKKDLLALFKTPGISTIAETNLTAITNSIEYSETSFSEKIQNSWHETLFVDIEYEKIISAGVIFDGQERIMEMLNVNKIFSVFDNKMPIHLYEGYYQNHFGNVITILTGLSWCNKRLEQIDQIIEENHDKLSLIHQNNQYKSKNINLFTPVINKQSNKQPTVNDISDLIKKFKRN
jgi:tubulin-like protein CetZ